MQATSGLLTPGHTSYSGPVLRRMNQVDLLAGKYSSITPYNFSFNNPVSFTDPSGAEPIYEGYTVNRYFDGLGRMQDDVVYQRYMGDDGTVTGSFLMQGRDGWMGYSSSALNGGMGEGWSPGDGRMYWGTYETIYKDSKSLSSEEFAGKYGTEYYYSKASINVEGYVSDQSEWVAVAQTKQTNGERSNYDKYGFVIGTFFGAFETGFQQGIKSLEEVRVITGQAKNGAYVSQSRNAVSLANKGAYLKASTANNALKWGGRLLAGGVIAYNASNLAFNGGTNQDVARFGVQSTIAVIGFLGPIGFGVSLGLTLIEINGGLNWAYDNFDNGAVHKIGN